MLTAKVVRVWELVSLLLLLYVLEFIENLYVIGKSSLGKQKICKSTYLYYWNTCTKIQSDVRVQILRRFIALWKYFIIRATQCTPKTTTTSIIETTSLQYYYSINLGLQLQPLFFRNMEHVQAKSIISSILYSDFLKTLAMPVEVLKFFACISLFLRVIKCMPFFSPFHYIPGKRHCDACVRCMVPFEM